MTIPFAYQAEAVKLAVEKFRGRALFACDMGLGKSLMALLAMQRLGCKRAVVVCPATIKWQWQQQASSHVGLRADVLEGTRPNGRLGEPAPITVVNYDILGQRQGDNSGPGWLPYLREIKPDLVVIDEAQNLANRSAKRTKWCRELCRNVPHVLALSGTPLTSRPAELWATLNLLCPKEWIAFWPYAHSFCSPRRTPWGLDVRGASNLETLHRRLTETCMIRIRKADVLKDLPPKRRIVVPVDLEDGRQYGQALNDFRSWLAAQGGGKPPASERLVQLGHLKRLAARLKLPAVCSWIDNFLEDSDEKLIVFAWHKRIVAALMDKYGRAAVKVTGETSPRDRQLAVDQFLTQKAKRVFVGNIQAAGVGWSAKGVSNVLFAELPWTPGALTQAEDRCHGIGRGKAGVASSVWIITARNTIEEKLLELLQKKQKVLARTLDGSGRAADLNIYDQLMQSLREEDGPWARKK